MKRIALLLAVILFPFSLPAQKDSSAIFRNYAVPEKMFSLGALSNSAGILETRVHPDFYPNFSTSFDRISESSFRHYSIPVIGGIQAGGSYSLGSLNLVGSNSCLDEPSLLVVRRVSAGAKVDIGPFTAAVNVLANNYFRAESGVFNQFGIEAMLKYRFSDISSITIFGQWHNVNPESSFAAYPFFSTSGVGGYMTFMGDRVGIDIGVERYFDPAGRQWKTSPIITPKIRLAPHFYFELPVGRMINTDFMGPIQNPPVPQNVSNSKKGRFGTHN